MTELVCLDIEATGKSPENDRIVSISLARFNIDSGALIDRVDVLCNPGFTMSDEVIAIHGITNEDVFLQPSFDAYAAHVFDFIHGQTLLGYNLLNFDIPMLWEEFYRADIEWDTSKLVVIDAGNIFKKKEERTLSAAVSFYCNRDHTTAHSASGDVGATFDVFQAQRQTYIDLMNMDIPELAEFSLMGEKRVDLAGKILRNKNGDYIYGLKSKEGVLIEDDPGFARWMLSKDFSENTKFHLRRVLQEIEDEYSRGRGSTSPFEPAHDEGEIPF